ncbi:MAG: phosphoserine phosphatase RsbU/P [Thermodesulfobacteriota bacterium]|nr:phosphoserine phosphatase RsbU/P [Thermodesulfobacteriota bacterium]
MPLAWNNLNASGKGGLAFRMSLFILTAAAGIFAAAFGYSYFYSRNQILADVEKNAEIITIATVSKIEIVLNGVEKVPSYLARSLGTSKPALPELQKQIIDLLQTNPEIFGSAVAYEPYAFDKKSLYSSPYICRGKYGGLVPSFLGSEEYQYFFGTGIRSPRSLVSRSGASPTLMRGRETS